MNTNNTDKRNKACKQLFDDYQIARTIADDNLRTILADNKDTEYGKKYGFADIHSMEEYATGVPLTTYEDYDGIADNPSLYTAYPIHTVLTTSGSTGKQKYFPLSTEALSRYSSYVHDMPYYLADANGKSLHVSVFRSGNNGANILSAAYFRWLHESGVVDYDAAFVGGSSLCISDGIEDIPYVKAWLMFSCPELEAIQSVYLYDIAMLMAWIEDNWKTLISDIRKRTVNAKMGDREKQALLENIPDDEWLDELEALLSEDWDEPILPRVWKNMKFVCGVGGKMYATQEQQIKRYIGELPIYQFSYALSECIIGPAIEFGPAYYALLPRSAYYEFMSEDGQEVLPLSQVKVGDTYELILSTFSGLYRYRTGDLIHIIRMEGEAPVFEMVGKRQQVISVAGEKTDVYQATAIVNRWTANYDLETCDYALGINDSVRPNGYYLFIEAPGFTDCENGACLLDKFFRESSEDYDDLRNLGLLSQPEIKLVPYQSIAESQKKQNKLAHSKPQIFLDEERKAELLRRSL